MAEFSAISHHFSEPPDWQSLRSCDPQEAANALRSILCDCEAFEKQVFAVRGMAMLLIEERELWTQFTDPEVGRPYASFDRWLKDTFPASWGYARDALRTVKQLRETPFQDLLTIPRCNLETMAKASSNVREQPKVIEAAKTLPEREFTKKLNTEFHQHIESKSTLKLTYTSGEMAEVEKALDRIGKQLDPPIEDRAAQLLAWCIDSNIENADE